MHISDRNGSSHGSTLSLSGRLRSAETLPNLPGLAQALFFFRIVSVDVVRADYFMGHADDARHGIPGQNVES